MKKPTLRSNLFSNGIVHVILVLIFITAIQIKSQGQIVVIDDVSGLSAAPAPENSMEDFLVFPNPATDRLHIQSPALAENYRINLIAISSQQVFTFREDEIWRSEKEFILDLTRLRAGMYILEVFTQEGVSRSKIMIL